MFRYFSNIFDNFRRYTYNMYHGNEESNKLYSNLQFPDDEIKTKNDNIDQKQLRIDVLLFVRQFKNTYYKYTNKDKFNAALYNSFIDDDNFDGGLTGFDDDDHEVRIFDKYILEYIKNRSEVLTYLQCKNKDIVLKDSLQKLDNLIIGNDKMDIIFAIDMNEKELFDYCYSIVANNGSMTTVKNIIFSMIVKYDGQYIRMKLGAFSKNKNTHPYLILERFMNNTT